LHCRKQYTRIKLNKTLALFGTHDTDVSFCRSGTRICDDFTSTNTDRLTHTYTRLCLCVSYISSRIHTFTHRTVVLGSSRSASYNRLRRHTPPPPLFDTHTHTHCHHTGFLVHNTRTHNILLYMCAHGMPLPPWWPTTTTGMAATVYNTIIIIIITCVYIYYI